MFKILRKTFKTGVVTTKYPAKKENAPERFRGKAEFDSGNCTFCGDCADACPSGVIRVYRENGEEILTISHLGCIFCGRCEEVCPHGAVKLTGEYEMASKTKQDLIAEIRRNV